MAEDDLEIIDPETHIMGGGKEDQYSHRGLVFKAMNKAIDAGSCEMKPGYWNQKTDKFGNVSRVYVEDTRLVFVSTIRMAQTIMSCDLDVEAKKELKAINAALKTKLDVYIKAEKEDWAKCHFKIKQQREKMGIYKREGALNKDLPYAQDFLNEKVDIYLEVLSVLNQLTKRLGFYEEAMYTTT